MAVLEKTKLADFFKKNPEYAENTRDFSKNPPVLVPLDLGYGFTKFARREGSGYKFGVFPSLAPKSSNVDLGASLMGSDRQTKKVQVEGAFYEVGPDSSQLVDGEEPRTLNDRYIYSEQYTALFYGMLSYAEKPYIDLLICGLPVNKMATQAAALKAQLEGIHEINDKGDLVYVKEVLVVPQPLGGLRYTSLYVSWLKALDMEDKCSEEEKKILDILEYIEEDKNLLLDPGFQTFDFLTTNGMLPIEARCGAYNGGVSKVLKGICESLSSKLNISYSNIEAVDKALRVRKIRIAGKTEQLDEHIKAVSGVIDNSINYMLNKIGNISDINNIIMVGGGSGIFRKNLENTLKDATQVTIVVLPRNQLANSIGYLQLGIDYWNKVNKQAQIKNLEKDEIIE